MNSTEARVLSVEDEPLVALPQSRALRLRGADVTVVHTFSAACAASEEQRWDAAVVDVGLADGCGLDVAKRVRENQGRVPILIQTGIRDPDIANKAHLLDAHCVWKPVDQQHLDLLLKRARAEQASEHERRKRAIAELGDEKALTAIEQQLLAWILEGWSYQEMAYSRHRSPNTIKVQVSALLRKCGCTEQAELVRSIYSRIVRP